MQDLTKRGPQIIQPCLRLVWVVFNQLLGVQKVENIVPELPELLFVIFFTQIVFQLSMIFFFDLQHGIDTQALAGFLNQKP